MVLLNALQSVLKDGSEMVSVVLARNVLRIALTAQMPLVAPLAIALLSLILLVEDATVLLSTELSGTAIVQ